MNVIPMPARRGNEAAKPNEATAFRFSLSLHFTETSRLCNFESSFLASCCLDLVRSFVFCSFFRFDLNMFSPALI